MTDIRITEVPSRRRNSRHLPPLWDQRVMFRVASRTAAQLQKPWSLTVFCFRTSEWAVSGHRNLSGARQVATFRHVPQEGNRPSAFVASATCNYLLGAVMTVETTPTSPAAWRPDITAYVPSDVVPDALILQCTNVVGRIEGDEPAVSVPFVADDGTVGFVAEGAEIPDANQAFSESWLSEIKSRRWPSTAMRLCSSQRLPA
jgi:hypothetical protein